jgi:hypothetical protein
MASNRPSIPSIRTPTLESEAGMIREPDRRFRHRLAYLGFCYALVDDGARSERLRGMVRRLDLRHRFRLQSLN